MRVRQVIAQGETRVAVLFVALWLQKSISQLSKLVRLAERDATAAVSQDARS